MCLAEKRVGMTRGREISGTVARRVIHSNASAFSVGTVLRFRVGRRKLVLIQGLLRVFGQACSFSQTANSSSWSSLPSCLKISRPQ